MATEVSPTTADQTIEIGSQIQDFIDRFEPYKQLISCDASEAQLREQIAGLEELRSEINRWGRDFLQHFGSIDGRTATFPLEVAIENAIDERFEIIIG